jgi:hygromycin-B 7''-O-kinase
LLPEIADLDAYRVVYRDESVWLPAMRTICARHGLDAGALEMAPPGSHVVYRAGPGRIIKLFSPLWPGDAVSERLGLGRLAGHPEIRVPRRLTEGELEGWPYLVLEPVAGTPLNEVWDQVGRADRLHVMAELGALVGALNCAPTDGLEALDPGWPEFVAVQTARLRETNAGAPDGWVEQIEAHVARWAPQAEPEGGPVLLHADITDEHVMLAQRSDGWHVTGLIDFGDAMLGHPLYEFAALTFVTRRDAGLRRALMLGYGFPEVELTDALSNRLCACGLLHLFGSARAYLEIAGKPEPRDLAELQKALWSFLPQDVD